MMKASFKLEGNLSRDLERSKDDIIREVKSLVAFCISKIEEMATREAPKFITLYSEYKDGGLSGEVGVNGDDPIQAYIEFGTGLYAKELLSKYPDWVQKLAYQFYVNGQGTLSSSPYLYNNFLVMETYFLQELEKLVKRAKL